MPQWSEDWVNRLLFLIEYQTHNLHQHYAWLKLLFHTRFWNALCSVTHFTARSIMLPPTDEKSSGKPSLLGSNRSTSGTSENHRVLAHLEGRKQQPSASRHVLEKGLLIALLIAGSGLYVWSSHRPSAEAPPLNVAIQTPAPEPMEQVPIEPVPQPARILQDSVSQAPDATLAHRLGEPQALPPTPQTLANAATKSAAITPSKQQSAPPKTQPAKVTAPRADTHKPSAKRAIASTQAPSRQAEKLDSDAELLATLLQRRDPQASEQRK